MNANTEFAPTTLRCPISDTRVVSRPRPRPLTLFVVDGVHCLALSEADAIRTVRSR